MTTIRRPISSIVSSTRSPRRWELQLAADSREILADQQRALLEALTDPNVRHDFDPVQIRIAARSLAMKRMHGVEKAWPALMAAAKDSDGALFQGYAGVHPLPAGGAAVDAWNFLRFLQTLDDDELNLKLCRLRATRGCPIRWAWTRTGFSISLRLWRGGVRSYTFRRKQLPLA